MSDEKNLENAVAIDKMKELAEDIRVCMFCTDLSSPPFGARPMSVKEVANDGRFFFFAKTDGDHIKDVEKDPKTQLLFSHTLKSEYLSVYGTCEISNDRKKIQDLWSDMDKSWFEGPEDPSIRLLVVKPDQGYYWDTKHGALISYAKIALSAITGNKGEDGVKGRLKA